MFFHRKRKYEMNIDTANAILQNVFAAGEKTPNRIPFDTLMLRGKADTRFYDRALALLAVLLCLTVLSPLAVVPLAKGLDASVDGGRAVLTADYVSDGCLYLEVHGYGVRYEQAWLEASDGTVCQVLSYDEDSGLLCFPYIKAAEANIYIPVENGEPLHLLLTPQ